MTFEPARRLQVQEGLTREIAGAMEAALQPRASPDGAFEGISAREVGLRASV